MSEIDFSTQVISSDKLQSLNINDTEPLAKEIHRVLVSLNGEAKVNLKEYKILLGYQVLPLLSVEDKKKDDINVSINSLGMKTGQYVIFFPFKPKLGILELVIKGISHKVLESSCLVGRKDEKKEVNPGIDLTNYLGENVLKVSRQLLVFLEKDGAWYVKLHDQAKTNVFLDNVKLERGVERKLKAYNKFILGNTIEETVLAFEAKMSNNTGNLFAQVIPDKFHVFRVDADAPAFEILDQVLREVKKTGSDSKTSDYSALIANQLLTPDLSLSRLLVKDMDRLIDSTIHLNNFEANSPSYMFFIKPGTVSSKLVLRVDQKDFEVNRQDYLVGRQDIAGKVEPQLDLTKMLGRNALKVSRQLLVFREIDSEWRVGLHSNARSPVYLDKIRMKYGNFEKLREGSAINIGNSAENPYIMIKIIYKPM
jgi:hypothetical protein